MQEASVRVQPFQNLFDVSDLRKSLELVADDCMETLLQDIKLSCNASSPSAALFPKCGGRDWILRIVVLFHTFMFGTACKYNSRAPVPSQEYKTQIFFEPLCLFTVSICLTTWFVSA